MKIDLLSGPQRRAYDRLLRQEKYWRQLKSRGLHGTVTLEMLSDPFVLSAETRERVKRRYDRPMKNTKPR